jgi:aspartyl/asparaginyl beta-hydroxylase (cupin superfamily)
VICPNELAVMGRFDAGALAVIVSREALRYRFLMSDADIEPLIAQAQAAERAGLTADAAKLWDAVAARAPAHPKSLFLAGRRLMERGDVAGAIERFRAAEAADPGDGDIPLHLALAHNARNELAAALAALDRALAIDPYFFMALLSKASVLERMNQKRAAAAVYANAIKIAPAPERLPPSLRQGLQRAHEAVGENAVATAEFLRQRVAPARAKHGKEDLRRFDECLDILAGVKKRQMHDPILLYYPRLAPIPFYDRELFTWLGELEAATDAIREELVVVLREDQAKFAPYIQFPAGAPVNQWVELNHSPSWSTFFLWRDGVRQDKNCARCPSTTALLQRLPLAQQRGYAPTAMFSVLAPNTHIPPHTGSSNTRLIVHLPLILPEQCRFRVGNETREWKMGEAWVFDDTIEHEAWNESDKTRVILIFDVWNPLLSPAERELVETMMTALNEYGGAEPAQYTPR